MRIALLSSATDHAGTREDLTWEQLQERLREPSRHVCDKPGKSCGLKKRGPAWVPAALPEASSPHDRVVIDSNVEAITAAVYDLDGLTSEEATELWETLQESGLRYIMHSSHGHSPDTGCYALRVVLELDQPVPAAQWRVFRQVLADSLNLDRWKDAKGDPKNDRTCVNESRMYFFPVLPEGATFDYDTGGDAPIDVQAVLGSEEFAKAQAAAPAAKRHLQAVRTETPEPETRAFNMDEALALIKASRYVNNDRDEIARQLILKPGPFPEHAHDHTLKAMTGLVRFTLPDFSTDMCLAVMDGALRASGWQDGYEHIRGEAAAKLARDWDRLQAAKEKREREEASRRALLARESAAASTPDVGSAVLKVQDALDAAGEVKPYSEGELATFALMQGCSVEELERRWVIVTGRTHWFLEGGVYKPQPIKDAAAAAAHSRLARAPIDLVRPGLKKNTIRGATLGEIVRDNGTVADLHVGDLTVPHSRLESRGRVFREAIAPLRVLEPVEHPEVQEWLDLLTPVPALREKLLNWVATASRLERPSCALYLWGKKDSGKSLLARGLSRLWLNAEGATPMEDFLAEFNAALARCPLVFADESLPQRRDMAGILRRMITGYEQQLRRKFLDVTTVKGSLRLMLAANNPNMLKSLEGDLTAEDVEAVSDRVLLIGIPPEASEYTQKLGEAHINPRWVEKNWLAEHALWLWETRRPQPEGRLWVKGDSGLVQQRGLVSGGYREQVVQWIVAWLGDRARTPGPDEAAVQVGNGMILVNSEIIARDAEQWKRRVPAVANKMAPPGRIREALGSLCPSEWRDHRPQIRVKLAQGDSQLRYWAVSAAHVLDWIEQNGFGDAEKLRELLAQDNKYVLQFRTRG